MSHSYDRLVIVLVRPSKYDDDGYVIRHWRGTLPSNTLSCLNSLTEDAVRQGALASIDVRVEVIDEIVSRVRPERLARKYRRAGTKLVAGLVGVQTNQFPRAQDLARAFRRVGFDVLIGGFHVSGAIPLSDGMPNECRAMLDEGVTLVLGEVEEHWADLLRDALHDRLRPTYNFLAGPPDLTDAPLPRASVRTQRKFVLRRSGTIDAGRGCPFYCSFCTIINVQGRKMRARSAAQVLAQIGRNHSLKGKRGIHHYFFTDDNFTRNPHWEEIFDGLIRMREADGIEIDFMMQVDTQAPKVPHFIEKAARAGCVQVFIGMETVRDDNLKAGGKPQNKTAEYRDMIARWHAVGVVCHVGYIIGFPNDTYERVMEDVRTLRERLLVDQASFFMLTPIPGSRDHQAAVHAGVPLDPDYNNFDSFHPTVPHPRMSADEWRRTFRDAWTEFYSFDQMRRSLLRQNPHTYWAVLKNLIWYRAAMAEGAHPMITGFVRLKDRRSRRPGLPREGWWAFRRRRARETARMLVAYARIFLEMQQLWLETRIPGEQYSRLGDLRRALRSRVELKLHWGWLHARADERLVALRASMGRRAQAIAAIMGERLAAQRDALGSRFSIDGSADPPPIEIAALAVAPRSGVGRAFARLNVFSLRSARARRQRTMEYWEAVWRTTRHLRMWRLNPLALAWNFACDARHALLFFYAMVSERY